MMLTSFAELLEHYSPYAWFAGVWGIPLVVVGALAARSIEPVGLPRRSPAGGISRPISLPSFAALSMFVVFVSLYSFLILYREDLIGLDYATITARRFVSVPIWPESGRFFPLALQEYNFLSLIGKSPAVYHAFSVLQLVAVVLCAFRLLDEVPRWFSCGAIAFMLVLPGFVVAFFGLVYPERDVIFWLAAWLICVRAFDRSRSRFSFMGAMVSAQLLLYYKETAFVLVGGFAMARLIAGVLEARGRLRPADYKAFLRNHLLELGQLALCGVFVVVYLVVIAPHVTMSYATNTDFPRASLHALVAYATSDYVLDAFVVVLIARLSWLLLKKRAPDRFWDALAIGAFAFSLTYVKLGMSRDYYQAPTEFIGALYVARLGYTGLRMQRRSFRVLAALVLIVVFQGNLSDGAHRLVTRKHYVEGNVRLASFLGDYALSHGRSELELYFPQFGGFELMEVSAFLQYKGLRGLGDPALPTPVSPRFIVRSAHQYPGDVCYPTEAFKCLYAAGPIAGNLVVLLSGRETSQRQLATFREAGREVFHFRPEPTVVERALWAVASKSRFGERVADVRVFENSAVGPEKVAQVGSAPAK